ncbi:MAG TPA: heavy-metal-associated domain-containing protein [Oligoflexia bacterium]|mgnify:CR=1 FL=1|nr:heavy-metal-associated domain-containing protein [Oligoflexia bacterium]HMP27498.1 heavy-metal-associated domain-containing protein [Oligoflexia bacterium]
MKFYGKIITTLLIVSFLISSALADTVEITVEGMVCASCAETLTTAFKKESAVKDITVEVEKKLVTLGLKNNSLNDQKIKEIIEGEGYQVSNLKRFGTTTKS